MKKIGIPGWKTGENSFGITAPYGEYIRQFGQCIILFPDDPIRNDLDLLLLPGGADVNPATQVHNKLSLYTGNSNPMLEYFDTHALPHYLKQQTPIFSICRGAQKIWCLFGGELNQNNIYHEQSEHPKDECHGLVWFDEECKRNYGRLVKKVNSRHHQTMTIENHSPDDIQIIALAQDNGTRMDIVEIFKHSYLPIWGTQYHPEDCPNDRMIPQIINELLTKQVEEQII